MKNIVLAAVAATLVSTAASAATYRIDVTPADGVKFAPFGAGEVIEAGVESSATVKLQAIDGKPVDAWAGHNNAWFIVTANPGDELVFTAMNGKSVDTIGQAVIELPVDTSSMKQIGTSMDDKPLQEETITDANRDFSVAISGYDVGADEGTDMITAVDSLGTIRVRELSK